MPAAIKGHVVIFTLQIKIGNLNTVGGKKEVDCSPKEESNNLEDQKNGPSSRYICSVM